MLHSNDRHPKWQKLGVSSYHFSENGTNDVSISGVPPTELQAIRERLFAKQKEPQGGSMKVDYIFGIPVELAFAICGYRHDRWKFDWGQPLFTVAHPE